MHAGRDRAPSPAPSGRCLCGAVEYVLSGEPVQVLNCHCTLCRSMNGAAFSTYVVVRSHHVRVVDGQSRLAQHAVTERCARHFCRRCGTPLFNTNPVSYPGLHMLYLGTLADAPEQAPRLNIYCESKLPWVDSLGGLTNFETGPARR